jgi:hypothetical protein
MELRRLSLMLLIFVATLLVSCSKQEADPFLVGDDDCKIPCWNSITPGLTTSTDAINRVESIQNKESFSFTESDIYFVYNSKNVHIHFDDTSQMVEKINFDLDDVPLGKIVDWLGQPEYLSFLFDSGGCTLFVYYPKTGGYFMGQCRSDLLGNHWKVSRSTKITQGFFIEPSLEEERLLVLLFGDASERMKNNIMKWDGYQSYPIQP